MCVTQVDDVELFQNIISDLFPGVVVPDQDHGELERAVNHVLTHRGLQRPHSYVTKVRSVPNELIKYGLHCTWLACAGSESRVDGLRVCEHVCVYRLFSCTTPWTYVSVPC